MAATPSVKISKTMNFRGATQRWTNRYHFNGGTPADNTHWDTLFDAIVLAEKAIFPSWIEIVEATGYGAGSDLPIHSKTYTTAGTGAFTASDPTPGECCALCRYDTTARTSKNHPVYLFSYWHGALWETTGALDELNLAQKAAMETYATHWISGFSDGALTCVRAGPNGATATARTIETWITHRDFRR